MNTPNIPAHITSAVDALLAPYGVSFSELVRQTVGGARYMTPKQASVYCGLSAKTIRDKALAGAFKSIRIGKTEQSRVLIDHAAFDDWLDSFNAGAVSK